MADHGRPKRTKYESIWELKVGTAFKTKPKREMSVTLAVLTESSNAFDGYWKAVNVENGEDFSGAYRMDVTTELSPDEIILVIPYIT